MTKPTAVIGALVSLLPLGQPLVIGTGALLTSAGVMLSAPAKVNAESAKSYFMRAEQKFNSGDLYGAIADYSKVIAINPPYNVNTGYAYNNRGNVKEELEDYNGAIADYNKAIEINPKHANAYYNRGSVKAIYLQDYYGAISDLSKAIEIDPRDKSAFKNRGSSKKLIGDMKGACADWREAVSLGHENAGNLLRNQCQNEVLLSPSEIREQQEKEQEQQRLKELREWKKQQELKEQEEREREEREKQNLLLF